LVIQKSKIIVWSKWISPYPIINFFAKLMQFIWIPWQQLVRKLTSYKQYIVDNLLNANMGNLYNSKSKMWQKHCISNKHMHNHITTKWNHIPNIQICIHNFYHISESNKKTSSWLKWTSSNYPNFYFFCETCLLHLWSPSISKKLDIPQRV
jgi:hypothetical protein